MNRSLLTIPEQPEVPDSVQKQEKTQDAKVEQTQNNFLLSETVLAHLLRDRGGADAVPGPVGPTTRSQPCPGYSPPNARLLVATRISPLETMDHWFSRRSVSRPLHAHEKQLNTGYTTPVHVCEIRPKK